MKLPIKKKFFDMIKDGKKSYEYRDAHITFICEETGEILERPILFVKLIRNPFFNTGVGKDILDDDIIVEFKIR